MTNTTPDRLALAQILTTLAADLTDPVPGAPDAELAADLDWAADRCSALASAIRTAAAPVHL